MNTSSRLGLFGVAVAATLPLFAQAPKLIEFRTLDANHDGRISSEEAKANADLKANFDMLDRNHDGFLTPDEFASWSFASKAGQPKIDPTTLPSGSAGAQHMPAN